MAGPNSADVRYAFDLALEAARQLYTLSHVIEDEQTAWSTAAGKATDSWEGGHREHFTGNLATAEADASEIKGALRTLADRCASTWAQARGEQDRINWHRWVQAQKDDDWWGEDLVDFIYEEDHGEPPSNPDPPTSPDYLPTRQPIHPEYENRGAT